MKSKTVMKKEKLSLKELKLDLVLMQKIKRI